MKNIWTNHECNDEHLDKHLDENSDEHSYMKALIWILGEFSCKLLDEHSFDHLYEHLNEHLDEHSYKFSYIDPDEYSNSILWISITLFKSVHLSIHMNI